MNKLETDTLDEIIATSRNLIKFIHPLRGQDAILKTLDENGPLRIADISNYLNVTTSSASEMVIKLQDKGYIEKTKTDTDGRTSMVQITQSGKEYLHSMLEHKNDDIFSSLDQNELQQLHDILYKLNNAWFRQKPVHVFHHSLRKHIQNDK